MAWSKDCQAALKARVASEMAEYLGHLIRSGVRCPVCRIPHATLAAWIACMPRSEK